MGTLSADTFRINDLPPYALGDLARTLAEVRSSGRDVIDFGQLNPDLGPPQIAIDRLVQSSLLPHNHRYSSSQGISKLRESAAKLYREDFGVELDVDSEVVVTLGTKEGLTHLLSAVLRAGEHVVVPSPAYPIHSAGVVLAGASVVQLPLFGSWEEASREDFKLTSASDLFFERLTSAFENTWPRPRCMIFSFPHNPTTTVVDGGFFERLIDFAAKNEVIVVHDFAYAELGFDGYRPPSILAIPGAKEWAVEFVSMSKIFNLPGWRVGFCAGNRALIGALKKIKSYLDFGVFQPLQIAAATVLDNRRAIVEEHVMRYQERRDALCSGLEQQGWSVAPARGGMFVWARIPERWRELGSVVFAERLLSRAAVSVCPGGGFDPHWNEFVRFALLEDEPRIRRGLSLMKSLEVD